MSSLNASHVSDNPIICSYNMSEWEHSMDQLYTYFYLFIFIPGLLGNSIALWVLCHFIRKKTNAIIFMINLAIADLLHVLSLPLRIYYYFTHTWPFGRELCMLCFYLKFLNMYASIVFLVCISIQRCAFLVHPFCAKNWKRRYDIHISAGVWLAVGLCCSPFILMRSSSENTVCFKDLPKHKITLSLAIPMMSFAELLGFVLPLCIIGYCSYRIVRSLGQDTHSQQPASNKRKALRMVLGCTGVFNFCFTPYHINFLLYLMVDQGVITHCPTRQAVTQFHPISLCMASLSCCLNPLIYYFLATEFRQELARHGSSVLRGRLMSFESTSSFRG